MTEAYALQHRGFAAANEATRNRQSLQRARDVVWNRAVDLILEHRIEPQPHAVAVVDGAEAYVVAQAVGIEAAEQRFAAEIGDGVLAGRPMVAAMLYATRGRDAVDQSYVLDELHRTAGEMTENRRVQQDDRAKQVGTADSGECREVAAERMTDADDRLVPSRFDAGH